MCGVQFCMLRKNPFITAGMADAPDAEIDFVRFFGRCSLEGEEKSALVLSGDGDLGLRAHAAILAISNRFGALFAATRAGMRWAWLRDLHLACDRSGADAADAAFKHISLDAPPLLLRINADEESLALLMANGTVHIFDVRALLWGAESGMARASHRLQRDDVDYLDLQWSPDQPGRAASLRADGALALLDVVPGTPVGSASTVRERQLAQDATFRSICWGADNLQLWCGHSDGTLSRFDTCAAAALPTRHTVQFTLPEGIEMSAEVSLVQRLSASHLLLGFDSPLQPNQVDPKLVAIELNANLGGDGAPPIVISVHEIATALFPLFREPSKAADGAPLRRRLHAVVLPEWRMAIACSSDSDAVCCIGSRRPGVAQRWQKWTLPDEEGPPSVPIFECGDTFEDQFVAGIALDLTNRERLVAVAGEEPFAPSPVVWALTSHGSLIAWTALHKKAPTIASGKYAFMREPEMFVGASPVEEAAAGAPEVAAMAGMHEAVAAGVTIEDTKPLPAAAATSRGAGPCANSANDGSAPTDYAGSADITPVGLLGTALLPTASATVAASSSITTSTGTSSMLGAISTELTEYAISPIATDANSNVADWNTAPAANLFGSATPNAIQTFNSSATPSAQDPGVDPGHKPAAFSLGLAGHLGATTTLALALETGSAPVVTTVAVEAVSGAPKRVSDKKLPPLHATAKGGDLIGIRLLQEHSAAGANDDNMDSVAPLTFAASEDRPDAVQLLLDHGADYTIRTRKGRSATDAATEKAAKAPQAQRPRFDAVLATLRAHAVTAQQKQTEMSEKPSLGSGAPFAATSAFRCLTRSFAAPLPPNAVAKPNMKPNSARFPSVSVPAESAASLSTKLQALTYQMCAWARPADSVLRDTLSHAIHANAKCLSQLELASARYIAEIGAFPPLEAVGRARTIDVAPRLRLCNALMHELHSRNEGLGARVERANTQQHGVLAPLLRLLLVDNVELREVERLYMPFIPEELRALLSQLKQLEARVERARLLVEGRGDEKVAKAEDAMPPPRAQWFQSQLHGTLEEHAMILHCQQARVAELAPRAAQLLVACACSEVEGGDERTVGVLRVRRHTCAEKPSGGESRSPRASGVEECRRLALLMKMLRERDNRAEAAACKQAHATLNRHAAAAKAAACKQAHATLNGHAALLRSEAVPTPPKVLTTISALTAAEPPSLSCLSAPPTCKGVVELPAVSEAQQLTPTSPCTASVTKSHVTTVPATASVSPSILKPAGAAPSPFAAPSAANWSGDTLSLGEADSCLAPSATAPAPFHTVACAMGKLQVANKEPLNPQPAGVSLGATAAVTAAVPEVAPMATPLAALSITSLSATGVSDAPVMPDAAAMSAAAATHVVAPAQPSLFCAAAPNCLAVAPTAAEGAPHTATTAAVEARNSLATFCLEGTESTTILRLQWYMMHCLIHHAGGAVTFRNPVRTEVAAASHASMSTLACAMSTNSFALLSSDGSLMNASRGGGAVGDSNGMQLALAPTAAAVSFGATPVACPVPAAATPFGVAPVAATPFGTTPLCPFGGGDTTLNIFGSGGSFEGRTSATPAFGMSSFGASSQLGAASKAPGNSVFGHSSLLGGGTSGFGVKPIATTCFGRGTSFGQPSSLGAGTFGQQSTFGQPMTQAPSVFSTSAQCCVGAFGSPLSDSSGAFSGFAGPAFNAATTASGGFGALAQGASGNGFGALAAQRGGFCASTSAFVPRCFGGHRG